MADVFFDYDACTVDALNRALDERLRAQAAEIERLRAALEQIADTDPDDGTAWFHSVARAALEGRT